MAKSMTLEPPHQPVHRVGDRARPRPKLHLVYFLLAGFDLLAVCLGLFLINRISSIYVTSVEINQEWADRLNDLSDLSQMAADVNAPGNDVFQTRNVGRESARLRSALATFTSRAEAVREDLVRNSDAARAAELLATFGAIDAAVEEMTGEASLIFSYFRRNEPELAGQRMAEMDRDFARVGAALADLGRQVRRIQESHFAAQTARAASLRNFELVIAAFIVLMVAGVTVYGLWLTRRVKQTTRETEEHLAALSRSQVELARHRDHLEELVEARTAELEASHAKLRLAERLASMGTLAAGLGHDMSNVLFPVRCQLDALDAEALPVNARDEVAALRKSVDYLQSLSDGLRHLALDPDDDQASGTVTSLSSWSREIQPLVHSTIPPQGSLQWAIPDNLPPLALAPHRLTQAVFNLVVNAREATGGQGTVTVRATPLPDRRGVRLSVSDDGPGMPEEVRRRVLDPFFTTKKRGLSTGLGLALVNGVVRSSGGTLEIESAPDRGTTVSMCLPAAGGLVVGARPAPRRAAVSVRNRRTAGVVSAVLELEGFEVITADGGDPDGSDLWVVDESSVEPRAARQYLSRSRRRNVVVLGEASDEWVGVGASVVADGGSMHGIQEAIHSLDSTPTEDPR